MTVRSALAAEEKNGLLAEQVPEPPGRIEPQRRAPGVERHRLLHLHPDGGAELAEILDGAVVDVGRVVPAVRQDIGLRHMSGEQQLHPHLPVAEIRKRHHGAPADAQHVLEHHARMARGLQRLRQDHVVEGIVRIVGQVGVGVDGRGIELSREGVNECVAKGLAVIQGDADTDLADYPDDAFDYVILSQTLQATRQPRVVLQHMLRIGRRAVVSFPKFGHWQVRMPLLFAGHMPQTDILPYSWYDTPNIHHCTIKDFRQLCTAIGVKMEKAVALNAWGSPLRLNAPWWFWNLFGEQAVFLLSRKG